MINDHDIYDSITHGDDVIMMMSDDCDVDMVFASIFGVIQGKSTYDKQIPTHIVKFSPQFQSKITIFDNNIIAMLFNSEFST